MALSVLCTAGHGNLLAPSSPACAADQSGTSVWTDNVPKRYSSTMAKQKDILQDPNLTGTALRILRQQRGLSQRDLASRIGLTTMHVSKFERGVSFNLTTLYRILEAMDASLVDLAKAIGMTKNLAARPTYESSAPQDLPETDPDLEGWDSIFFQPPAIDPDADLLEQLLSTRRAVKRMLSPLSEFPMEMSSVKLRQVCNALDLPILTAEEYLEVKPMIEGLRSLLHYRFGAMRDLEMGACYESFPEMNAPPSILDEDEDDDDDEF